MKDWKNPTNKNIFDSISEEELKKSIIRYNKKDKSIQAFPFRNGEIQIEKLKLESGKDMFTISYNDYEEDDIPTLDENLTTEQKIDKIIESVYGKKGRWKMVICNNCFSIEETDIENGLFLCKGCREEN